ncbi:MarR family winged helix-turn-helix transcriptional regulator [Seleniivibrio sp.]|uniref:MarR family winged helix-turn-helix transcriptional regulator n=1 Tax=Seleniivibrio sp. TaxID=2898801 RepID=UPI0025E362D6|nr:MarR family winged helix-turn-helix transcriptional regulator [Seleniivibrio sp.]MCD8552834.1 MarR family winged helix-turn-helix transcriptional regulator [Seleniivibrio sp.]
MDKIALDIANQCLAGQIKIVSRVVIGIYDRELRSSGLKITQASILVHLLAYGSRSGGALGRSLQMDKSTVSRNIDRMERHGWVNKTDEENVEITEAGRELILSARPQWEKAQKIVCNMFGSDGVDAVKLLTDKVKNRNKRK